MLMHLAVARETARGLGKKHMGLASWSTHLPSTKILIWLLSGGRGGKNYTGSEEKFVLVMMMDPNWGRQAEEERQLYSAAFELHQWHTFNWLHCQKNWHQHIWGRYAWSKWGYDWEPCLCTLSMFYQDCATGVTRRIVCVSSQDLTVTLHIGNKLSVEEKDLIKSMPYKSPLVTKEEKRCPDPVFNLTASLLCTQKMLPKAANNM